MDAYIGMIMPVAFNFAPINWAVCNGAPLAIQQNTALYSLIGTTFGGNNTTTFNLPNLQGRSIVGFGQGPGLSNIGWGQASGTENVTLQVGQLPAHNHAAAPTAPTVTVSALSATPATRTGAPAAGSVLSNVTDVAAGGIPLIYAPAGSTGTAVNLGGVSAQPGAVAIGMTGGNAPVQIRNPYLGLYCNICLFGIFPQRP